MKQEGDVDHTAILARGFSKVSSRSTRIRLSQTGGPGYSKNIRIEKKCRTETIKTIRKRKPKKPKIKKPKRPKAEPTCAPGIRMPKWLHKALKREYKVMRADSFNKHCVNKLSAGLQKPTKR